MNEQALSLFPGGDRRSGTGFNRFRRFLNNYWLVPILICYLQLANQMIYPANSPIERLEQGNRAFLQGLPVAYQIATREFPFTLLGHFYEIGLQVFYRTDLFQIPHEDLKTALNAPRPKQALYNRLLLSRTDHESEVGGLLAISYQDKVPTLHFHEISSLNKVYLEKLRSTIDSPSAFLNLIISEKSEDVLKGIGIQKQWVEKTTALLQSDRISEPVKKNLRDNFLVIYEALSESRYILSPYQFKEGLGKIPFNEHYVGIFHFHNGLNQPPSETDIQQSMRNRQIVLTFSETGWRLYDIDEQDLAMIDIKIDNRVTLQ